MENQQFGCEVYMSNKVLFLWFSTQGTPQLKIMAVAQCSSPCEQWETFFRRVLWTFDDHDLLGLPHAFPESYDKMVAKDIEYQCKVTNDMNKLAHESCDDLGPPPPEINCGTKIAFNQAKNREEVLCFVQCSGCQKGIVANCTGIHFHPFGTTTQAEKDEFLENWKEISSYSNFHPDFIN